jgi:hypothetical protein
MSWLSDITGLSESDIALPSPSWTGTVDTATASGVTPATASGLLNSIGSAVGSVADFGFNVQKQQMAVQSQAQDNQLKSLLGNLGFQTAVVQATSAADIAKINAQKSVAQAQGTGGLSLSPTLLLLIAGGVYFMAKKG